MEEYIEDFETKWINETLEKFIVELVKPLKGLYINDSRVLSFRFIPIETPIILGDIEIELIGPELYYQHAPDVLFFIDDKMKYNEFYWNKNIYNWTWDEKSFGKHKIKVIALGFSNVFINVAGVEISAWKFF